MSSTVHRSIRRLQWLSIFVVVLVLGGGGAWMAITKISGAVVAPAVVVVESHPKKVQHLEGGTVAQILIGNGERVKAGDVLIRLDSTEVRASAQIFGAQLRDTIAGRARLIAERDDAGLTIPPEIFRKGDAEEIKLWQSQQRLLEARRTACAGKKQQLVERIAQLEKSIKGANAQAASKTEQSRLIARELNALRGLEERQLVTQSRVLALEREAAKLEGERVQFQSEAAKTEVQIGETRLRLLEIDQSFLSEVLGELRDIEVRVVELTEKHTAATARLSRTAIVATQSGIVDQLAMHTIGGVVMPGDTILQIVPENDVLVFEGHIPPADIDRVRTGQKVTIRLTAFNRHTTPELAGSVRLISADARQETPQTPPFYLARIVADQGEIARLGSQTIQPGMPAELFIEAGQRSVLSYLVKPVADQMARVFREQ